MSNMNCIVHRAKMLREWRSWIENVVKAIKDLLPDAEIYVIGSVAEGRAIATSDLDLLVVSARAPKRPREIAELRVLIEEKAGLPPYNPLEIHFASPEDKERYFRKSRQFIRLA